MNSRSVDIANRIIDRAVQELVCLDDSLRPAEAVYLLTRAGVVATAFYRGSKEAAEVAYALGDEMVGIRS